MKNETIKKENETIKKENETIKKENETIKKENETIKKENEILKEKLKKYTNNDRHKKYYEKNKEIIKQKAINYIKKIKETAPEKIKIWSHNAYLHKKMKTQKLF